MHYRQLGETDLMVSEIGFGAWGIGGVTPGSTSYGITDDAVSVAALKLAFVKGVNFFDTSNVYGYGHSERLIGQVFSDCRDKVVIATKAGFVDYEAPPDFSASAITRSVDGSLVRLQTDYIDLLQLHNPSYKWLEAHSDTLEALLRLQESGKVRELGVSVKSPDEAINLLDIFPFRSVQANFNMLDIRVLECGLLEKMLENGAGFIARTPLAFGFLSGLYSEKEVFPKEDHRSRWPREQIRLWVQGAHDLYACCEEAADNSPDQLALRFCLSYPQVSTAIVGMLTSEEVDANVVASDQGELAALSCAKIEKLHHDRLFVVRK